MLTPYLCSMNAMRNVESFILGAFLKVTLCFVVTAVLLINMQSNTIRKVFFLFTSMWPVEFNQGVVGIQILLC